MSSAEQKPGVEAELGPHSAFVVQFHRGTELSSGAVSGRVEHVVSGRVARFHSLDELIAFVRRVLSTMGDSHAGDI